MLIWQHKLINFPIKQEINSEPTFNTSVIASDGDPAVAAMAMTCYSDDDLMSLRKPNTLPKILDGKFYKNIQPNQKTPGGIQATCTSCYGLISGTTKSTGNFLSHIKRRHKELLPLCQLYCQAKSNVSSSAKSEVLNTLPATSAIEQPPNVTQLSLPTSFATTTTHLAMPMPLTMPMSMPVAVQAPQMLALMHQQHQRQQQNPTHQLSQLQTLGQAHSAVYISKDY